MPKDIRYLSERRKNQLINYELNYKPDFNLLHLNIPNTVCNIIEETERNFVNLNYTSCENYMSSNNQNEFDESLIKSFGIESDESNVESLIESQFGIESNDEYNIEDNISISSDITNYSNKTILSRDIQTWIVEHNIPHNTANKLLVILRRHGHIELPSDVRILLQTPRNASINFKSVGDGRYVHFGLLYGLERSIKMYSKFIKKNEIKLNINIDGFTHF